MTNLKNLGYIFQDAQTATYFEEELGTSLIDDS